jgi:uncharacterized membrane protein
MGIAYIVAGLMHFLRTPLYVAVMPSYLPHPKALVFLSGIAEVAGGVGILVPQTRRTAAWGLVLLLIAVFPANITMLDRAYLFPQVPLWALWLRLPLQLLLIAWAAVYTKQS